MQGHLIARASLGLAHRAANVRQIRRLELFAADGSIGVTQDASGGDESDRTGDVLSAEVAGLTQPPILF